MASRKPLTPEAIAARRKNAQKSTGPRTEAGKRRASLNALKHGSHARSLWGSMKALGEEPQELRRLLADLLASHRPANPSEIMLVEDLAALRWQRRRCQRAQAGQLARRIELLEQERHRRALELSRDTYYATQAEVLKTGLRRSKDSPAKFRELLAQLDLLLERVDKRDFSQDARTFLQGIYGDEPTLRGAQIINLFVDLLEAPEDAPFNEDSLAALRMALLEESRDVTEEYQCYLQEEVEISPALRNACLAPAENEWRLMIRQENAIDRQIERKIRLLLQLQKANKAAGGQEAIENRQTSKKR